MGPVSRPRLTLATIHGQAESPQAATSARDGPPFVSPWLRAVALLARQALAIVADMVAMSAPTELLIGASAAADATEIAHSRKRLDVERVYVFRQHASHGTPLPGRLQRLVVQA